MNNVASRASRITHLVSYVSQDGAYGGPVAVAMGQVAELARRGHEAEFLAGWDGFQDVGIPNARVTLVSVRRIGPGFGGLVSPKLWSLLLRKPSPRDVFHVHLGRDPISLISAWILFLKRIPYVVQTHGMIMPRRSITVRLLDAAITRRVLKSARRVLVLTTVEANGINSICRGDAKVELIPNGITPAPRQPTERQTNRILFLARLHPRKRVMAFAEMCRHLVEAGVQFTAHVVGPDEGDLASLRDYIQEFGLSRTLTYEGPVGPGESVQWLASSAVFVLPSVGEVFPMTILEALAAGTPVVTTEDSGLASMLVKLGAAAVTDGSPQELATQVAKLLRDEGYRSSLIHQGYRAVEQELSIGAVVTQLETAYNA